METHRQFVEKLLKFKNIATSELILDCGMRKLGVSIYFLIKKEKSKTENKLNGFGKDHFWNKHSKPSPERRMDLTATSTFENVNICKAISLQYNYATEIIYACNYTHMRKEITDRTLSRHIWPLFCIFCWYNKFT